MDISVHLDWYRSLPLYYDTEHYFFCHAGVNSILPLDKQKDKDLLWIREDFFNNPKLLPKTVVFGHTPQRTGYATFGNGAVCVDGGAVFLDRMTALIIEDGNETIVLNTMSECERRPLRKKWEVK